MAIANSWCYSGHSITEPHLKQQFHSHSLFHFKKQSNFFNIRFLLFNYDLLHNHTPLISQRKQRNRYLSSSSSSSSSCCCSKNSSSSSSDDDDNENRVCEKGEWDWTRWSRHFSDIEQAESFSSLLKFQLDEAVEKEDFLEAAKLKKAFAETMSKDWVTQIMAQLKNAIDTERYHDASRLSRCSGSGLVGWWAGWSKDSSDPFGRLVHITPEVGRFVGRSYTPRQLVTSSPGTLLFEIFVVKDADETYLMQVVYLQQQKENSTNSLSESQKVWSTDSTPRAENATVVDIQENEAKVKKSEENAVNIEEATEEGIKSVVNFLKEKLPGLKVKVINADVSKAANHNNDPITRFMQEGDEKTESDDSSDDEASILEKNEPEEFATSDNMEEEFVSDRKTFTGGVLQNKDNAPAKLRHVRIPAGIREVERDTFVLRVPGCRQDEDSEESKLSKIKVAAITAQGISELMPADVAKAFLKFDRVSLKVSKDVREIVELAISQAQRRNKLSEYTQFSRIATSNTGLDPFEGLYVGAYGPYGTEVVQLRHRFGHWNRVDDDDKSSDVEFFEYVEAVKLTGDLNVPAGKVTFRAKVGKGSRIPNREFYPDELGVVTSYKGQGRIAEFGYRQPRWVDGQLLQLNGKGIGPVRGADLGFLYVSPAEQSFLVLFNRLTLPD